MAVIGIDIGSSNQVINSSNYDADAGDTLQLNVLGSNTLTVDGVDAVANTLVGVQAIGTPTFAVINGGSLSLNYGLANVSALTGVNYEIGDGSSITVDAATLAVGIVANNNITFTGNGGGAFVYDPASLSLATPTTFTVNSMAVGDSLWVEGRSNGTLSYNSATQTATLNYNGNLSTGLEAVRFQIQNISQADYDAMVEQYGTSGIGAFVSPVCFLRGTMIQTTKGEVAVEDLVAGDVVIGKSGERTVKWVGFRKTFTKQIPADRRAEHMPIRIVRDAIAENVPSKDIVVSPGHHLYVEGKLVRAKDLVNGKTIYQETHHISYEYFHVELDQFDVISAHGIMSESWADGGNRDYFQNADVTALRPEDRQRRLADRPGFTVVRNKAEIQRLQATYAARAEVLEQDSATELKVACA
ncbi:Hint domain-containing protein [Bordetella sp. 15P40C-2]|uniref:Hint domain-containing protein n=1 Tax=Bordetella sp. 15P40C-2 TaxID=2572246 RepID=UPI0013214950|nr:Hint domain-containing protein [Bordetella sp. 15P40C-2]MVW71577.1 hypothetical protein [Bordetella sp. 15P40C-2]